MMTTSNEPSPPELCRICGDPENDHDRIHPFTREGDRLPSAMFSRKKPTQSADGAIQLPFDPVLRQALLDKGILTPADLMAADQKVSAIIQGKTGGVGHDDSGLQPR